jgi:hypothetical protein
MPPATNSAELAAVFFIKLLLDFEVLVIWSSLCSMFIFNTKSLLLGNNSKSILSLYAFYEVNNLRASPRGMKKKNTIIISTPARHSASRHREIKLP